MDSNTSALQWEKEEINLCCIYLKQVYSYKN